VNLEPVTEFPITSYAIRLALPVSPQQHVRSKQVPQSASPAANFSGLVPGQTYVVTATSKIGNFEGASGNIGNVTLCNSLFISTVLHQCKSSSENIQMKKRPDFYRFHTYAL